MFEPEQDPEVSFTERELRFLMDRSLGRLGFVCGDMIARVMPVLFEFDGVYFYLSGWNLKYSERFRGLSERPIVTLLVDDVTNPGNWTPRGIEVTGTAEGETKGDYYYVRIKPATKTAWGFGK